MAPPSQLINLYVFFKSRVNICTNDLTLFGKLPQVIFGAGSVVGKLGVEKFNPLLFALIREGIAGPLLLAMAVCHDGCLTPAGGDWTLIVAMGFCVFANQAFAILGIKLAGPVISSAWQCSQPIFTLTISLLLGWEPPTWRKVIGRGGWVGAWGALGPT